ncbi:MAG: phenylalanine--tRNA ligase subunit beta, partial [Acidimicrobiales bacterium]
QRNPFVRLFEVGRVFPPPAGAEGLPEERELVAVALAAEGDDAAAARRVWDVLAGALRLDGPVTEAALVAGLHPGRAAHVRVGGVVVASIGEVDPTVVGAFGLEGRVGWVQADLGLLAVAPRRPDKAAPVSRFPSTDIDLAFVVADAAPAAAVEAALRDAAGDLLVDLRLFDVYRGGQLGAGRRSLAYRLRFNALSRTLTDDEVGRIRAGCIEAVEERLPASLRA